MAARTKIVARMSSKDFAQQTTSDDIGSRLLGKIFRRHPGHNFRSRCHSHVVATQWEFHCSLLDRARLVFAGGLFQGIRGAAGASSFSDFLQNSAPLVEGNLRALDGICGCRIALYDTSAFGHRTFRAKSADFRNLRSDINRYVSRGREISAAPLWRAAV